MALPVPSLEPGMVTGAAPVGPKPKVDWALLTDGKQVKQNSMEALKIANFVLFFNSPRIFFISSSKNEGGGIGTRLPNNNHCDDRQQIYQCEASFRLLGFHLFPLNVMIVTSKNDRDQCNFN